HFLLNSLSSFSHIIKKDQLEAENFLDSLTSIYRYFMKHNQSELVSLEEEFEFMEHYLYLLSKRYGNAYQVENHALEKHGFIIPFAIQMCVENAIKHNEGFDDDPLKILIESDSGYITVRNNLRPVKSDGNTGYGIKNLKTRSKFYAGEEVIVDSGNNCFTVKIPVVKTI
ncbi:MAG: histidine kinase, partial [Bacteroidetes bacterium]